MTSIQRLALLASFALICGTSSAQDALFADAPGLFEAAPAAPAAPAATAEVDDPLVKQLLELARRGDLPLADAIASLARLERWDQVDRLLARTAGRNLDNDTMAAMFRRIGPTLYLQIKQRPEVSGPAQAGIDKLRDAAAQDAQSEAKLSQAIAKLGSDSRDEQLAGTRTLLSGGNAAIQTIIAAAVQDQPAETRDHLLRTLLALDEGAVDGLRQLALYGTPDVRARAVQSLARISRRQFAVDLATALHATDATEQERQVAADALRRSGELPSREASIEALTFDLRRSHELAERVQNDGQVVTLWSVNDNRDGVTHQPVLTMHAAYREVHDAAARLRRIGELSPELDTATLAVAMAYRLMVDPDWGDPEQIQTIRDNYANQMSGAALSNVLEYALASGDHPASVGLIRLIDPQTLSESDRQQLLAGSGGLPAPLVRAVFSPEPRVRYEAALLLARLSDGSPYAGSSEVERTLREMASLRDEPTVIVVETRPQMILPIENALNGLGLHAEVVGRVSELERSVARGGDLRMVIAKSDLVDRSAVEMIDSVRRMNRGRQLPIVVYGDQVPFLGEERWEAPTSAIEGMITLASLDELLDLVKRGQRMPPLTILDRQRYRETAAEILAQ